MTDKGKESNRGNFDLFPSFTLEITTSCSSSTTMPSVAEKGNSLESLSSLFPLTFPIPSPVTHPDLVTVQDLHREEDLLRNPQSLSRLVVGNPYCAGCIYVSNQNRTACRPPRRGCSAYWTSVDPASPYFLAAPDVPLRVGAGPVSRLIQDVEVVSDDADVVCAGQAGREKESWR